MVRRLKFLLRPGWLALAAVVAVFAFLCFSVLAPWQLGKNTTTSQRNDLISESVDADPVPLSDVFSGNTLSPDDEWRRVVATGSYVQDSDALVRLRSIREQPAYEVISPFLLDDGRTVMVNRGYVLPVEGTRPPEVAPPPTGAVTLDARLRQSEGSSRQPIEEAGFLQVYNIDPQQIGPAVGVTAVDGYLQLDDAQPGGLGVIDLPQTDAGPYLSYGLQWLAFGIMAPLGLLYFVRAEIRERRKSKVGNSVQSAAEPGDVPENAFAGAASAGTASAGTAGSGPARPGEEPEFTLPSRREKRAKQKTASAPMSQNDARLADRYGKNR